MQDRLSSISLWNIGENWWLIFAPILMVFALFSPEGIQGLVQRVLKRERFCLIVGAFEALPPIRYIKRTQNLAGIALERLHGRL